jgi:predicted Zn-dependent peptidase
METSFSDNVIVGTLSNLLKLITIDRPWSEMVSCLAIVKLGSCDEQLLKDKGSVHMLEHTVWAGTREFTEKEINAKIIGSGGVLNASTSHHWTAYYINSAAEDLAQSLEVLDSVLFRATIDPIRLEKEKRVVLEEIGMYRSSPGTVAATKAVEALFPGHNVRFPILGDAESVEGMTATRLREYVRSFHRPQTMALMVSGKIPPRGELEEMLFEKAPGFAHKTRASNATVLDRDFGDATPGGSFVGEEVWADQHTSTTVNVFPVPPEILSGPLRPKLRLLTTIIGGAPFISMMHERIREEDGLCYACGASTDILPDLGMVELYAQTGRANVGMVDERIAGILTDVREGRIDADLISHCKNFWVSSMKSVRETNLSYAQFLGSQETFPEDQRISPEEAISIVRGTTVDDLVEVAEAIFSTGSSTYRILDGGT